MRITRAEKSVLSDWWFTVDRLMFFGLLLLMGAGLVLSLAASPPIAAKFNLEPFHFVRRQAALLLPAVVIMFAVSTLTPKQIRRASLIIFVVGIALMAATMLVGPEIKGAKRWLQIGFFSIQPSEFVKPAFVVLTAWLFNESQKRTDVPGIELALAALRHLHAHARAPARFRPGAARHSRLDHALLHGRHQPVLDRSARPRRCCRRRLGLFPRAARGFAHRPVSQSGVGRHLSGRQGARTRFSMAAGSVAAPGRARSRTCSQTSHTDFIFAVAAEEYGLIACLILLAVFAFIVLRGLSKASQEQDGFIRHATAGLIMLFGLQTLINMAVNVGLLPAKGMTLPFISYGGSSLLAMALTMGFVLGLTRRRPMAGRVPRSAASDAGTESAAGPRAGKAASEQVA